MASEAAPAAEAAAPAAEEEAPRERVSEHRYVGLVIEWRGYMGWIHLLSSERIAHEKASKHQGRIYINQKDVSSVGGRNLRIKEGKIVDFLVYADDDGLGAEDCRPRTPLRLTLPHRDANSATTGTPQWSEYLTGSEYFPNFEKDHGVTLRKYTWPMPYALIELWGHPEELAVAVLKLAKKEEPEDTLSIRLLVPDTDVPKVESLPHSPKVSTQAIICNPIPCRSLEIQGSEETCAEFVKAFALAMPGPQTAAA